MKITTKLSRVANFQGIRNNFQNNLDRIVKWAEITECLIDTKAEFSLRKKEKKSNAQIESGNCDTWQS